jgi:hypothetical protein
MNPMITDDIRRAAECLAALAVSHPDDESLVAHVGERFGQLGPREVARAALYASTDPAGQPDLVLRLYKLGMQRIRRN